MADQADLSQGGTTPDAERASVLCSPFSVLRAAQPPIAIPAEDWARLAGRLTARQLGELREWVGVMHAFLAAAPEARALAAGRLAAAHAGLRGLSLKSLYRKAAEVAAVRRCVTRVNPSLTLTEHVVDPETVLVVAVNNTPGELLETLTPAPGWRLDEILCGAEASLGQLRFPGNSGAVLRYKHA